MIILNPEIPELDSVKMRATERDSDSQCSTDPRAHRSRIPAITPTYTIETDPLIMRYTLRLLTLQQFQRAAALICACEVIRREDADRWGSEPFRIGLWVGQRSTPNWVADADEAIKQLKKGGTASFLPPGIL